jgi:hypothetical protein
MITVDPYTIIELWDSVKPYVQQKDKQIAAEAFACVLNEAGVLEEIVGEDAIDKFMSNAMEEFIEPFDEDEEY